MPEPSIRNVIVTGAASGVGAATVSTLVRRGYAVHAFVRDPDSVAIDTGAAVPRLLACDISDPLAVESAVDDVALLAGGELHGVVHSAVSA
jgi:NAD(P)-dependent dehydrogenase (short-subunit alcohol dehydrogenase family)